MNKKTFITAFGAMFAVASFIAMGTIASAQTAVSSSVASPVVVPAPACPAFSRSFSIGSTGTDVTMLQNYLNTEGYLNVSSTGYFGPLTYAAVARWQAQGGVVALGGYGSGSFGPLSRAYFSKSCGNAGGGSITVPQTAGFSTTPASGIAPLTVQFTSSEPQGGIVGGSVDFGDGTSGNLLFIPTCSSCNLIGTVSHVYVSSGIYTAELLSQHICVCPVNGICNCPNDMILSTTTVMVDGTSVSSTTSNIQQLNAPGSVAMGTGGIAEIRNANFYFTLTSTTASTATIAITKVGCWNSFPSDPSPKIICMIAVMPTPSQTLSVGQTYIFGNYPITLTNINDATATFSIE